jgi:hypothetical protein
VSTSDDGSVFTLTLPGFVALADAAGPAEPLTGGLPLAASTAGDD